jgi:hypothetical protein
MPSLAEPILRLNNQQLPDLDKFSIPVSSCLSLDVYSSTKPHNLKIASLQKGLILTCNGVEKVGEGAGFGFPALVGFEETFFSRSASVTLSRTSESIKVVKEFDMNSVARNTLGNARLENQQVRAFVKRLCDLYQNNKHFRFLPLNKCILDMGVETRFKKIESAGRIPVTYEISGNVVDVRVDLNQIEKKHRKAVFVLNEQSASFFRRYSDSQGTTLVDDKIGAWDKVNAEHAWFTDIQQQFGFRLRQSKSAVLRRGRETMRNCLDWVGLDYELNPNVDVFEYSIELLGAKPTW